MTDEIKDPPPPTPDHPAPPAPPPPPSPPKPKDDKDEDGGGFLVGMVMFCLMLLAGRKPK